MAEDEKSPRAIGGFFVTVCPDHSIAWTATRYVHIHRCVSVVDFQHDGLNPEFVADSLRVAMEGGVGFAL